ncbi:MAG: FtsX-like permease family protein [Planctomycetes bacterium]|nr:FtsX-like permease family protein [Planctomycetota bacterium]
MTEKRDINVQDQAKLSLAKVIDLVRSGIKHRILRSGLTMAVILLAVAFFMSTLTENVIINQVAGGVASEISEERSSINILNHIYTTPNALIMSRKLDQALSDEDKDENKIKEIAAVIGWDLAKLKALANQSHLEQLYFNFFDNMSIANRKMLIGNTKDRAIFALLQQSTHYEDFQRNLEPLRSLRLPTKESDLKQLLHGYEDYIAELKTCQQAWTLALKNLKTKTDALTKNQEIGPWICTASDAEFTAWKKIISNAQFTIDENYLNKIRGDMQKQQNRSIVTNALLSSELKIEWNKTFLRENDSLETKLSMLGDDVVVLMINTHLKDKNITFTQEDLAKISSNISLNANLASLETDLSKRTSKQSGSVLSGRQTFLLIISFFVCMVGIANAMLMAITERFREIATMKCLGATDSFILIQFMVEASIQGVAGGICGMFIGFLLAIIKTSVSYGSYPFSYFPPLEILICAVVSLAVGIVLAIFASLYPSWAASRMAPMEAMRIE